MKNHRKFFSMKEALQEELTADALIDPFTNDFSEGQLLVYKDPFRVALIALQQSGTNYNGFCFQATVLHYFGLQLESNQLFFDLHSSRESEISLFNPTIYFSEIESLLTTYGNQILDKYKNLHSSLLPELIHTFGDSTRDWIMYLSFLAIANGTSTKTELPELFRIIESQFEKKLSPEILHRVATTEICFHPYVLFNSLRLPSVDYFNQRLRFLVRNFNSGDSLLWRDFETELRHLQSYGFALKRSKTSFLLGGFSQRMAWKELIQVLSERKQKAIISQRYEEAARLRDMEREILGYLNADKESCFDFFETKDEEFYFKTPADDFLRMLLVLKLGSLLKFND
jgi:UvrB/uvrC motif